MVDQAVDVRIILIKPMDVGYYGVKWTELVSDKGIKGRASVIQNQI
jgi:hypothetical protein